MKTWIVSRFSIVTIFVDINSIMKVEMATACTGACDNNINNDQGNILFRATNIAGLGRTHVSLSLYFFMLLCLCITPREVCSFTESTTKKWSDIQVQLFVCK